MSAAAPADDSLAALQCAVDAGDLPAALALCEARIAAAENDATAWRQLAQLQVAAGERGPALRSARRACELAPDDARVWSDLGRVCAAFGTFEDAVLCFDAALEIDVRHADAWHNLGLALRRLGRGQAALAALKNALRIDPARADSYLALASLLTAGGQLEAAIECLERAVAHDPTLPQARNRLARQWWEQGRVERAQALFRESLGMDPQQPDAWLGLGRALEDLGDADGALEAYLQALVRRPDHALALHHYLALARADDAGATSWLARADDYVQGTNGNDEARALVGYGLAKFHHRHGRRQAAAQAGRRANAARRHSAGAFDRTELAARVDGLIDTYTRDFFHARKRFGLGTDQPIFIVGLPRSGTTLTEQILAAHPQLHGAGELPALGRIAAALTDDEAVWRAAAALDEGRSREQAHRYLRALRDGAPMGKRGISDKSPLNFFQLALVALLFPNARVVHCVRDPRDVALSIWLENFNPNQRYATDFADLADFHGQYTRLMAHWRAQLPLPLLELRYEETVADPEAQARRLLAFLDVPWDAGCLDFHRQQRAVQTPSRWQVRQPVYTGSVGRWRDYAPWLPELETAFAPD